MENMIRHQKLQELLRKIGIDLSIEDELEPTA